MKTLISIISILLLSFSIKAQSNIKTVSFKVSGNCDECKNRIENAADIKGVKLCVWNKDTHLASVTYNAAKVTLEQIKQAIANAGHDVEGFSSPDPAYKKLPDCCKYRDANSKAH